MVAVLLLAGLLLAPDQTVAPDNPVEYKVTEVSKTPEIIPEPSPRPVRYIGTFRASAYTDRDAGMDGSGITASGTQTTPVTDVGPATAAVDPRVIPLGSRLYIPHFRDYPCRGYFRALDTGGAIKGQRLDINYDDLSGAYDFGTRPLDVYILEGDTDGAEETSAEQAGNQE